CHHDVEAPIDAENAGVLFLNSRVRRADIKDGLAYTLFLGEKFLVEEPEELGWMSGTRATLRNTGQVMQRGANAVWIGVETDDGSNGKEAAPVNNRLVVGTFESPHAGRTVNVAMGDG